MIIYGSKATEIAKKNIATKCPACHSPNSLQISVYQNYAHVFWIPIFPIRKIGITQCSHCKQVLQQKEFDRPLTIQCENIKEQSKTPLWSFSGLAIIVMFVTWGVIISLQNDEKNAKLILTPQTGDIYEIKKDYKQYTLYKVERVEDDTVYLLINDYETNKITGLAELKNKGNEAYGSEIMQVSKNDLKNMLDKGEIVDIDRK